jgi:P4 family phage/plasmid primase-like protien
MATSDFTINDILESLEILYSGADGYKVKKLQDGKYDYRMLKSNASKEEIEMDLTKETASHIQVYLNYDEGNVFCIDIDDETLTNEQIHDKIQGILGFLPPYTLSASRKKPHYYVIIEGFDIENFKKRINFMTDIKADLIKDLIVEANKTEFYLGGMEYVEEEGFSLPTIDWFDFKKQTVYKVADKKPVKKIMRPTKSDQCCLLDGDLKTLKKEVVAEPETKTSNVIMDYLNILNLSRFDDYGLWIQLLMCCKNLNVDYAIFDSLSSKCANYDPNNNQDIWDNYKKNTDKLLGLGRIKEWAKEDNPDKFIEIEAKYNDLLTTLLSEANHAQLAEIYYKFIYNKLYFNNKRNAFISYNEHNKLWSYDRPIESLFIDINNFFKLEADKYIKSYTKKLNDLQKQLNAIDESDGDDKDNVSALKAEKKRVESQLKIIEKTVKSCGSGKNPENIVKFLKGYCWREEDFFKKFNENPYVFAFNDGFCYDFMLKSVRPITETDYLTISCGYPYKEQNLTDIEYVYNFIYNYFEDTETTKSLLSALSCSLIGNNKNEIFVVLTGKGRNGKSTLEGCMSKTMGGYYTSLDIKQLTLTAKDANSATPEMAGLEFKRFVMSQEPESAKGSETLKVATIKKLTGNDPIKCRKLQCDIYEYKPQFTLYLSTNDIPNLSKKDDAIKHRMKVIHFPFMFVGIKQEDCIDNIKMKDENIKQKVNTEQFRYGLLWLLINTYNETDGKFYQSTSISEHTNEFFHSQNPIRDWFNENYEIDASAKCKADDIYKHYRESHKDFMAQTAFGSHLKELIGSKRSASGVVYQCKRKQTDEECLI